MYRFESKNYFEILSATIQKVSDRLEKYLQEPNEENVHNVRTAIRRLESAWIILPRKVRQKRKVKKFVLAHKKFFKTNSQIRDFDIIQQRLDSLSIATDEIKKLIYERKKRALDAAKKQAKQANRMKFPKISQNKVLPLKLEKRFRKVTTGLIDNIQVLIPVVIHSEKKVSELHRLRKDCKKLRYLMELTPTPEASNFVVRLRQMQDLLGLIRDSDITMDFLKKISPKYKSAGELLGLESQNRVQLYTKFVETHQDFIHQK